MFAVRFADRSVGLISTMVLARLLIPSDFGLVAMATALVAMVELMTAFSLDLALIQKQKAERKHYDTAWTFTVIFGVLTSVALFALAIPAARFFAEPRLEAVVYFVAAGALIQSFQNIGIVAFRKELNFKTEFILLILQRLIGTVITLILAFTFRSYWALVLGIVSAKIANVALSYLMHPYRPRFSLLGAHDLMHFSRWLLLNNFIVFGATKGYDFIVGKTLGAFSLGLYSVANEIANLPTTELVFPVSRAIFPGFAKLSVEWVRLKEALLNVVALVAVITLPLGAGIAMLSEPLVRLILGEQWVDAIPLIRVLALYGVVRALHAGFGNLYLAVGLQRVLPLINIPHIVVGWPLTLYLLDAVGIAGAAWGILCGASIGLCVTWFVALRLVSLSRRELLACYWRPLLAVGAMSVVESMLIKIWPFAPDTVALLFQTLILIIAAAIIYTGVLLVLWLMARRPEGPEKLLLEYLFMRKATS